MINFSLPLKYRNTSYCFGGGGGSAPAATPPPPPAPTPVTTINPVQSATDRAKTLQNFKMGLASTLKTPTGFTGTGTQLSTPSVTGQKKVLG